MYKSLIIGCGNIGALYDLNNDKVLTHVKAFTQNGGFEVSVFDEDKALVEKIAKKYNVVSITHIDIDLLKGFDCVSICTPTSTHYKYLSLTFEAKVKVIVCEKPISLLHYEISDLISKYKESKSSVLVNYIRRFLPAYQELKNFVKELLGSERILHVSIRYQRGFINNCSHALDLLQFLLQKPIILSDFKKNASTADHFENDPTISATANWDGINFSILGLSNVKYSYFEIDIYIENYKIQISEAGNVIDVYKAVGNEKILPPLELEATLSRTNCVNNYMVFVASQAHDLISGSIVGDNFLEAADLNLRMLQYLND
jgi:predicted dehydrogenase